MMSVMGTMIIFALSYNMLLGQTGLLSFGHAVYFGLGGFVAIHMMNVVIRAKLGVPVAIIPLVGGLAGLGFGFLFGLVSTKKAGIVFSMISLGIGELVSSSSFILRTFFGGEEGITTNRSALAPFFGHKFGPQIEVYYLIAAWCFFCDRRDVRPDPDAVRADVQRGARQSRAGRIRRLFAARAAHDRVLFRRLLRRDRRRAGGDQFRDHELGATRRGSNRASRCSWPISAGSVHSPGRSSAR